MKVLFVSWAEYCSRSDNIARELGGSSHMVYWGWLGSNVATVWLKYLGQTVATLGLLLGERPDVVFVMAPPVFAVLPVYIYSLLARVPFVIDAHTAAFLHPRWAHLQWLQRFLCQRAATTIVTNEHLAQLVRSCGANATIVRDVPVKFVAGEDFTVDGVFNVGVVCSFNDDEPVEEVFRAAGELKDVHFYVTGNPKYLKLSLKSRIPDNVQLTGFIPEAAYGSLLARVDAVITLTTRNHTMLRGAYESVYQGTPVIVSDWPLLREAFDAGAIHIDNSSQQLVAAIREMRANLNRYRTEVNRLRAQKYTEWDKIRQSILMHVMKDPERVKSALDALSRYEGHS
jgi:glycosyltransferase involved in cell wall biosynthesis